jgi:hypothetical protein
VAPPFVTLVQGNVRPLSNFGQKVCIFVTSLKLKVQEMEAF